MEGSKVHIETPGSPVFWIFPQLTHSSRSWTCKAQKPHHVISQLDTAQCSPATQGKRRSPQKNPRSLRRLPPSETSPRTHSAPATRDSSLFPGCSEHGPASEPVHALLPPPGALVPRRLVAHSLTSSASRLKCHLLGEADSGQPTHDHNCIPSPTGPATHPRFCFSLLFLSHPNRV